MIEEKQLLLDEVKEQISASSSFVIMRYEGVKANKAAEFRRKVAGLGGSPARRSIATAESADRPARSKYRTPGPAHDRS